MRVSAWLIFALFLSLLVMDIATVWMVRGKLSEALEHSLDAALVGGLQEEYAQRGYLIVDEYPAYVLACSYLKKTLGLNEKMENQFIKNAEIDIDFIQDQEKPRITGTVSVVIKAASPLLFGGEGIPVTIRKTQYHLSKYK